MLYDEFLNGTGCKDNDKNYKVYKDLEIIYINTDCTKEHIYEMGKKLVDNGKSDEQIKFENEIKAKIAEHKEFIKNYKISIENECGFMYPNKSYIKYCKNMIDWHKGKIRELRWIIR